MPPTGDQPAQYQFSDFKRSTPLLVVGLIFAAVVIVSGPLARLRSADRAGICGLDSGHVHVSGLDSRSNPIMVGLIGASAIMFVALYVAHGFSARPRPPWWGPCSG